LLIQKALEPTALAKRFGFVVLAAAPMRICMPALAILL
jgi:hypothetical protein